MIPCGQTDDERVKLFKQFKMPFLVETNLLIITKPFVHYLLYLQ